MWAIFEHSTGMQSLVLSTGFLVSRLVSELIVSATWADRRTETYDFQHVMEVFACEDVPLETDL